MDSCRLTKSYRNKINWKRPFSRIWIHADLPRSSYQQNIKRKLEKIFWKASRAVLPLQLSRCLSLYASISQESVRLRYHLYIRRSHLPSPFSTLILFAFNMHSSPLNSSSCVQLQCWIPGWGRRRVINEIDLFVPFPYLLFYYFLNLSFLSQIHLGSMSSWDRFFSFLFFRSISIPSYYIGSISDPYVLD